MIFYCFDVKNDDFMLQQPVVATVRFIYKNEDSSIENEDSSVTFNGK